MTITIKYSLYEVRKKGVTSYKMIPLHSQISTMIYSLSTLSKDYKTIMFVITLIIKIRAHT